MKKLTVNQLILLLQIHRGTLDKEWHIGTMAADVQKLESLKLIQHGGGEWHITSDASKYLERAKVLEEQAPKKDLAGHILELQALGFSATQ